MQLVSAFKLKFNADKKINVGGRNRPVVAEWVQIFTKYSIQPIDLLPTTGGLILHSELGER